MSSAKLYTWPEKTWRSIDTQHRFRSPGNEGQPSAAILPLDIKSYTDVSGQEEQTKQLGVTEKKNRENKY